MWHNAWDQTWRKVNSAVLQENRKDLWTDKTCLHVYSLIRDTGGGSWAIFLGILFFLTFTGRLFMIYFWWTIAANSLCRNLFVKHMTWMSCCSGFFWKLRNTHPAPPPLKKWWSVPEQVFTGQFRRGRHVILVPNAHASFFRRQGIGKKQWAVNHQSIFIFWQLLSSIYRELELCE